MRISEDKLVRAKKCRDMDYKQTLIEYIVRACECVMRDPGRYLPDEVYTDMPGELTIHIPYDGIAYVEAESETFLTEK